jgi:cell division ATPase FtsA
MEKNLLFSLDIGTRSVVGIVGEQIGNNIKINILPLIVPRMLLCLLGLIY